MNLKIKVTKDVLERSAKCGQTNYEDHLDYAINMQSNCAIALAVRAVFPTAYVYNYYIHPGYHSNGSHKTDWTIDLPEEATRFIEMFDVASPEERILMHEIEFEVELNDQVLAAINIEEAREALKNSTTLELIEA